MIFNSFFFFLKQKKGSEFGEISLFLSTHYLKKKKSYGGPDYIIIKTIKTQDQAFI